jgi:hypothetical protein
LSDCESIACANSALRSTLSVADSWVAARITGGATPASNASFQRAAHVTVLPSLAEIRGRAARRDQRRQIAGRDHDHEARAVVCSAHASQGGRLVGVRRDGLRVGCGLSLVERPARRTLAGSLVDAR